MQVQQPQDLEYYRRVGILHSLYWDIFDLRTAEFPGASCRIHPSFHLYQEMSDLLQRLFPTSPCFRVAPLLWDSYRKQFEKFYGKAPSREITASDCAEFLLYHQT